MESQLCQYRHFLEYDDSEFSARLVYSYGGHGIDGMKRKILVPIKLVFGFFVGFVAIVVRTSEGPDIGRVLEDAVGVVVFRRGSGEVELDQ
jgi:hypothetical protein